MAASEHPAGERRTPGVAFRDLIFRSMRIFLSYAAEDRDTADQVQLALVARGHRVFFDRKDVLPGADYQTLIRTEVERSDYFIFLIAPESVSKGSFALTELKYARNKWDHPRNRVLPVVVRDVPWESIPTYLKAVNILEPEGNVAAEITLAAARSSHRWGAAANGLTAAVRMALTHQRTRAAVRLLLTLSVLLIGLVLALVTGNGAQGFQASQELGNFISLVVGAAVVVVTFSTWRNFGKGAIKRLLTCFGIFAAGLFLGGVVSDGKGEDALTILLTVWTAAFAAAIVMWRRMK